MKGGASVVGKKTLIDFLNEATKVEVLTDHSLSCLTLKITGVPGTYKNKSFTVKKPQSANKSRGPGEGLLNESVDKDIDIETILVKLMPKKSPLGPVRASIKKNDDLAYGGTMHIVSAKNFYKETQTSINVYFSTLLGSIKENIYQEPVCPAILEYFWENPEIVKKLREFNLEERIGIKRKKPEITDQKIFENILNTNPSIIVMEFLEGYITLDQYEREYYKGNSEKKIKNNLAEINDRILAIEKVMALIDLEGAEDSVNAGEKKKLEEEKTKLVSKKTELEGEKVKADNKKALHYAYYCTILYQIYRMTKYSKIRHEDLHLQNIMIKITDIPDEEIKEVSMEDKIKSILNNSNFKINIKIIDYGEVSEILPYQETKYFSDLEIIMDFLFTNYNKVFEEKFMYAKFLSLTDISEILSTKDSLDIGKINLKNLKYYDIYKGSIEALAHINDQYFKRLELLLQEAVPLGDDVAQGSVAQGANQQTSHYLFVLRALAGQKCQTGTFTNCGDGNPKIIIGEKTIKGKPHIEIGKKTFKGKSTYLGGGKKSKKNNKRKRKFRSKKNKK